MYIYAIVNLKIFIIFAMRKDCLWAVTKQTYYESVFRNLYLRTTKIDLTLSLLIIIATFGVDGQLKLKLL